jgi:hypothetical protein
MTRGGGGHFLKVVHGVEGRVLGMNQISPFMGR